MAFPWIFEATFDSATATPFGWDSEQDTGGLLDLPHYSDLARFRGAQLAPYRGAYCMRVVMGDTNDHTLREGDIDIADTVTRYASFYLYLGDDMAATANDTFNIFELQQAGGTVEASLGLRITALTGDVEIGIGDGTAPTDFSAQALAHNRWYHIEVEMLVSTAGVGTLQLFVDGVSMVSLTGLTNAAAVGSGDLGTQDTLATTTGTLLFDWFVFDDTRIFPQRERFPHQQTITQSVHAFVGPGVVEDFLVLSTTAGNIARLFDTDTGNVNDAQGFVAEFDIAAASELVTASGPWRFERGCFVQMTGTNPRAQVRMYPDKRPPFYSAWGVRHYGQHRKQRPNNV